MAFFGGRFFVVFLLLTLVFSLVSASSVDKGVVSFSSVSLNGVDVDVSGSDSSDAVLFSVERGSTLNVVMGVVPFSDVDRVEFQAFISGYSLNDVSGKRLFSSRSVSKMSSGVSYPVSFSFVIPKGLDVGDYSVSVSVWDRSGLVQSLDIPFIVRSENYGIAIKEILLGGVSSGAPVAVGEDIIVRARLENSGLSDEDVRVEFSIPSLGVSDVFFFYCF